MFWTYYGLGFLPGVSEWVRAEYLGTTYVACEHHRAKDTDWKTRPCELKNITTEELMPFLLRSDRVLPQ